MTTTRKNAGYMTTERDSLPAILGGTPVRASSSSAWPIDDPAIKIVFEQLLRSGDWGRYHGPHCPELCRQLAAYHGVEHVHLCSSGTSAVELALRGLNVSAGDEVIMAAYDFKANFQNVLCVGATPVLVDLLPSTWQIDPTQVEQAITAKTKAILVSHLHGGIVPIDKICQIARMRDLPVIEDACQNPGTTIQGRRAGTIGDIGTISFGGSKLLTAGRGGAVLTNQFEVSERIKRYMMRGNDAYPLSEFQAAVLIPQLSRLDVLNSQRRTAVEQLIRELGNDGGLTILQQPTSDLTPAYYKVGFQYEPHQFSGLTRDQYVEAIRAEGVPFDAGFRSLHLIHAQRRFRTVGELPQATKADTHLLILHHPILLEGDEAIDQIATAIKKIQRNAAHIAAASQSHFKPALESA